MRLASRWSWSAACRVCSREMTRSRSPGARLSSLADSGGGGGGGGGGEVVCQTGYHMEVFIVPIRCEPVGTTVLLGPDQRVASRGFGAGSSIKRPLTEERSQDGRRIWRRLWKPIPIGCGKLYQQGGIRVELDHRRLRSRWRCQDLEISSPVGDRERHRGRRTNTRAMERLGILLRSDW